jgi:hypothetical protein
MLKRLLFETQIGEWLLGLFERLTGLALVDAADVESMTAMPVLSTPTWPGESQP